MSLLDPFSKLRKNEYGNGICVEAIDYQPNSKLPVELTAIFQKVLDFAEQHDRAFGAVSTPKMAGIKHKKIYFYIEKVIQPLLAEAIARHTNARLDKVEVLMPVVHNQTTMFYMVHISPTKKQSDIDNHYIGDYLSSGWDFDLDAFDRAELVKINAGLDKATGRILEKMKMHLYVGIPVGAFVVKDMISGNVDDMQMTASEITAVFLHELGHHFSFMEYAANLTYTGYYGNNILQNAHDNFAKNKKKTIAEAITTGEKQIPSIKNETIRKLLTNSVRLLKSMSEEVTILDKMTYTENDDAHYNTSVGESVERLLIYFIMAIICGLWELLPTFIFGLDEAEPEHELLSNSNEKITTKNWSMIERLADEYVSRYGMSRYLNSAMIRMNKFDAAIFKLGFTTPMYTKAIRDNSALHVLMVALMIPVNINNFINSLVDKSLTYENVERRLRRNKSNTIDLLKSLKVEDSSRRIIINDIDQMEKDLEKIKPTKMDTAIRDVARFIINAPSSVLYKFPKYIFGSAGVDKEYAELFEHIDDMLSNKGFYYSAKIDELIKKGKH